MALTTFVDDDTLQSSEISSNFANEETRDANIRAGFRPGFVARLACYGNASGPLFIRPRRIIQKSSVMVSYYGSNNSTSIVLRCLETNRVLGFASSDGVTDTTAGSGPVTLTLEHEALLPGFTYTLESTFSGSTTWSEVCYTGYTHRGRK